MRLPTLTAVTVLVAVAGGCSSALATGPDATVLGTWRSASGPEQFVEVDRVRVRTLTWVPFERCCRAFEFSFQEEGTVGEVGWGHGSEGRTWALSSEDGAMLVAERRGSGETATRTYERRAGWTGTTCD